MGTPSNPAMEVAWIGPYPIEKVRDERSVLPSSPGVYVFTNHCGMLTDQHGVWYVGKAGRLSSRVRSYLVDPMDLLLLAPRKADGSVNSSLRHAAKAQLLVKLQQRMRYGDGKANVWLRWTICQSPETLERRMIEYFQPAFNSAMNPRS